eukprot:TRINITY_DN1095_c0_g1_i1.p1 TRINITY_DN1095_c0_g1~~TRINITY_DN1095_c0_g1_i1.p1  ORF type:complete len:131 (-),score=33.12 TRINITY_DN1095_c0_g1_i1:376-768(-)
MLCTLPVLCPPPLTRQQHSSLSLSLSLSLSFTAITDSDISTYYDYLLTWQAPANDLTPAMWGEWIVTPDQSIKTPDLSLTFHTVSYVTDWGNSSAPVPDGDALLNSVLATQNGTYPYGWQKHGKWQTHNL